MSGEDSLLLEAPGSCLQQAGPRAQAFRTLVGLDYALAEQVLMPSLERLAGWVLNLENPGASPAVTLFQAGLNAGAQALAQGPSDPVERLAAGLGGLLEAVVVGLSQLIIRPDEPSLAPTWGCHAGSLWGWARTHDVCRVRCERRRAEPTKAADVALFAGRLLSGATLACLETHRSGTLRRLWTPPATDGSDATGLASLIGAAARALVQRGLWRPEQLPGRIWRDGEGLYLLWPLAGEDLRSETAHFGAVPVEAAAWIGALQEAGCVQEEAGMVACLRPHPLLRRPVQALRAAGPLADALRSLWP